MKKSYFLMAAAATMFAACSQNDVLNEVQVQEEAKAIGFSTYAGKVTRAENNNTAVNTSDLEAHHTTFKVWGYKNTHTDYIFGGVRVTANGSAWTYSPKKYWDKAATSYQFYAAAPDNGLWNLSENGSAQDDDSFYFSGFSLQGTSLAHTSHQVSFESVADCDLMIASPCSMVRTMYGNDVQLAFNHILSRLNVRVKKGTNLAANNEELNITSFKVYKLKKTGNFNETLATGTELEEGTIKRWTNVVAEYEIAGNALNGVTAANVENQYIFQALVIPQEAVNQVIDRDGTSDETAPYFTIEYTIGSGVNAEPYSATFNLAAAFAQSPLYLCEGYENTLTLTIDAETIVFDASVYEWTDKFVNNFEVK